MDDDLRAILAGLAGDPLPAHAVRVLSYGTATFTSRRLPYAAAQNWVTAIRALPALVAALTAAEAEVARLRARYEQLALPEAWVHASALTPPRLLEEDAP